MVEGAWKFWGLQHDRPCCFVVAAEDRRVAARLLWEHGPMFDVIDVEHVPERVLGLLEMGPGQVTRWEPRDE